MPQLSLLAAILIIALAAIAWYLNRQIQALKNRPADNTLTEWLKTMSHDISETKKTLSDSLLSSTRHLSESMTQQTKDIHDRLTRAAEVIGDLKK
jgi:hypothetical protein